jgi:hypothetical protein
MSVRETVRWVDDLDGGEAAETVLFGLDGVGYELDLSAANAAALRAVLGRYVAAARRLGRVEHGAAGRVRQAAARANRPPLPAAAAPPAEAVLSAETAASTAASADPPEPVPAAQPTAPAHVRPAAGVGPRFSDRPTHRAVNG